MKARQTESIADQVSSGRRFRLVCLGLYAAALSGLLNSCDHVQRENDDLPTLSLEQLNPAAEIGADPTGGPFATVGYVQDAVFIEDRIAVLDRSPPYVRLFSREGVFLGGIVREGDGPGEATWPLSLDRAGHGALLLTEERQVSAIGLDGQLVDRIGDGRSVFRGGATACGNRTFVLATHAVETETGLGPGAIVVSSSPAADRKSVV